MSNLQVEVMNGTVGVGDCVIWHSKKFGIRRGKVNKICQEAGWRTNYKTYMSVIPTKGSMYASPVPLRNFLYVCKEFTPEQIAV